MEAVRNSAASLIEEEDEQGLKPAVRVLVPLFESESAVGDVFVEQPQTAGSAISRHTTYLVKGVFGEAQFSSRKRYSDFEWLRKILTSNFPGVFIPKIPPKQTSGRFEDAFVEERRFGLEVFLQRCFRRRYLVHGSPILRSFLQSTESSLEDVKKEHDRKSVVDRCREFKTAIGRDNLAAQSDEAAPDGKRLSECRIFLDGQVVRLRELAGAYSAASRAQRKATVAVLAAQKGLAGMSGEESGMLRSANISQLPRVQLLEAFRQQKDSLEEAPSLHYDVLHAAAERELEDAEAMQEALVALEELQSKTTDLRKRATSLQVSKKHMENGGDPPASLLGSFFGRKDKETQLQETRQELIQTEEDASTAKDWFAIAVVVALDEEMNGLFSRTVELDRWATQQFAKKSKGMSDRVADGWGALATELR